MSADGPAAAELHSTLQQLAARMAADGHPIQAIKCYLAVLNQSMLPSEEAATRLKLSQLLLQHTLNVQDAKQHLQKAEMLVMPLHGQHLLKCEVLSALATAHGMLGEVDFQRRCYNKGLEQCRDVTASSADKQCLVEWAVYYHMHLAESLASKGQTAEAVQQVEGAATLAGSHNLLQQQVLCNLFLLQLALLQFDRREATALDEKLTGLVRQLEQQQGPEQAAAAAAGQGKGNRQQQPTSPAAAAKPLIYLRLHFTMLQLIMKVQFGQFKELYAKQKEDEPSHVPPAVEQMDELLEQLTDTQQVQPAAAAAADGAATAGNVQQHQLPYAWLPVPAMAATVHLLAAVIDKTAGRRKQGQARLLRGLQVLDSHLAALLQDKAAAAATAVLDKAQQELQVCLSLRVLMLEVRQQLHLLCSDFAGARADAVESINMLTQFPQLLSGLSPVVHLQAGLYAQDVGAHAAAVSHFTVVAKDAQQLGAVSLAADARAMAAVCCLAQGTDESATTARELLGPISTEADTGLGYASRALQHTAMGLLQLSGSDVTTEARQDANQHFSKALKMAHGRLHNHQVVSQLLMLMAPLQVAAANMADAKKLLSSCVQLSHGAADLPTQIKALSLMQPLLEASGVQDEEGARNRNYVARKEEELSGRIQEAEADAQQHHLVLTWGLS